MTACHQRLKTEKLKPMYSLPPTNETFEHLFPNLFKSTSVQHNTIMTVLMQMINIWIKIKKKIFVSSWKTVACFDEFQAGVFAPVITDRLMLACSIAYPPESMHRENKNQGRL